MEILGVDFSGARPDNNTWVAQSRLDGQELVLESCRPVSRSQLSCLLEALPSGAVASLDFPFSVPLDFARFWRPEARAMPDLWSAAAAMTLEEFMSLRDAYVARRGEPKRLCDSYHPECYSCLHKVNPNMVPMTFYGMKMLAGLWPRAARCLPWPFRRWARGSAGGHARRGPPSLGVAIQGLQKRRLGPTSSAARSCESYLGAPPFPCPTWGSSISYAWTATTVWTPW